VLQPGSLPEEYRLPAQLGRLRRRAQGLERSGLRGPGVDFADVLLHVDDQLFR
jgi:hypothetical protein